MPKLPLSSIAVGDRIRSDVGDIAELADSLSALGLIQPIVVDQNNRLVAGGRRFLAAQSLGWTEIDVFYRETLSDDQLREMELEENLKRKDMDWKEKCLAIAEIHRLKSIEARADGLNWTYKQSAYILGVSSGSVTYHLTIAQLLKAGDKEIANCSGYSAALDIIVRRREDEVNKIAAQRTLAPRPVVENPQEDTTTPSEPTDAIEIPLSSICHFGSCIDLLDDIGPFTHIISDPPYAIDMDMLQQQNTGMDVSEVRDQHHVDANLALLKQAIPLFYLTLPANGFCVLWCDAMNFRFLHDLGLQCGFAVQRWPLVWAKTSPCLNQAADYNYTKSVEFAIVMRKPGAKLRNRQPRCHFFAGSPTDREHAFEKPAEAWNFIFDAVTMPGERVFDPFMGRGSMLLAAIDKGLKPVGCEIEEDHFSRAVLRVKEKYTSLTNAVFI